MLTATVDFKDPGLFGNDAAEDEDDEIFKTYAFVRPELQTFQDTKQRIQIARAYKGEGKSALLRLTKNRISANDKSTIIVSGTGSAFSPDLSSVDSDAWVRVWKERLFRQLANEIGARFEGFAWTDDAMSIVEEAERNAFRKRNLISAIFDRIKPKEAQTVKLASGNPEELLKRWMKGQPPVWFFIDDIDQNFQNTATYRTKIAAFFIACRQIVNLVPQMIIRSVIRPNVWTIIKRDLEALSHVEQYIVDLHWTENHIRTLLAHRIRGQFVRRNQEDAISDHALRADAYNPEETLIGLAFESPMPWGFHNRPAYIPLSTLSQRRPRWLIELCKAALAVKPNRSGKDKITLNDLNGVLKSFGRRRIEDTVAEFKSLCPEIEELITAFANQSERYVTADLTTTITNRVLQTIYPHIFDVYGKPGPLDVAALLFQIGFLSARRDRTDGTYEHITFSDNPTLLSARTNIDQGVSWEIHPVFRQALNLRDKMPSKKKR
jgi:hypothetical protein